jgi:hypothetical protein
MGGYGGHGLYLDPMLGAVNHLKQSPKPPMVPAERVSADSGSAVDG